MNLDQGVFKNWKALKPDPVPKQTFQVLQEINMRNTVP